MVGYIIGYKSKILSSFDFFKAILCDLGILGAIFKWSCFLNRIKLVISTNNPARNVIDGHTI